MLTRSKEESSTGVTYKSKSLKQRDDTLFIQAQNTVMQQRIKMLREELKVVDYHIEFEVDGRTPKQIL